MKQDITLNVEYDSIALDLSTVYNQEDALIPYAEMKENPLSIKQWEYLMGNFKTSIFIFNCDYCFHNLFHQTLCGS